MQIHYKHTNVYSRVKTIKIIYKSDSLYIIVYNKLFNIPHYSCKPVKFII